MTHSPATLILLTFAALGTAQAAPTAKSASPLNTAKTLQVTETIMQAPAPGQPLQTIATLDVKSARPGLLRLEQTRAGSSPVDGPEMLMVSDGKTLYQYMSANKQYRKEDAPADIGRNGLPGLPPLPAAAKLVNTALDGRPALLYTTVAQQGPRSVTMKLWLSAGTRLPVRESVSMTQNGKTQEIKRVLFSGWVLDKPIAPSAFAFNPPPGSTEYIEPKLLAAGTDAPDFTALDPGGKAVKLSDYRGKVVVLDFWATWCGPCQMSLPHTNKVAQQFKDRNVVVLAVNVWDTQDAFDKWLPQHKEYDAIRFTIDPTKQQGQDIATRLYNVSGIPTQYVIDPAGKVAKTFVGFSGPTDDLKSAINAALQSPVPATSAPAGG